MQATSGREKRGGTLDNGRPPSRTLGKKIALLFLQITISVTIEVTEHLNNIAMLVSQRLYISFFDLFFCYGIDILIDEKIDLNKIYNLMIAVVRETCL